MSEMKNDQRVGFDTDGYIQKKGITASQATNPDTRYNMTPPGMDINDQKNADIRTLPWKTITGMGYPGDGWNGQSDDLGG